MERSPNESFWIAAIDRENPEPPLLGEHRADVVCVGGGYTSLVTAYLLKKREPSLDVVVVESDYVGFGASGRNGGMVLHEPHLERLSARGAAAVRFTFEETQRSVDFIDALAKEEGFDCELERTGYLDVELHRQHARDNQAKHAKCRSIGIELERLDRAAMRHTIRSDLFQGALRYPHAAMLHPGKLIAGLKRAALRRGVTIHEGSEIRSVTSRPDGALLRTPAGQITADRVVVGLNAYHPTRALAGLRSRAVSLFSFIVLTEPLRPDQWDAIGWRGREGYSDKRRLHNYVRLTGNRILFGGRVRYRFGVRAPHELAELYQALEAGLVETFPSLAGIGITHRWCGPVAITWSRRPWIGERGRVLTALGYSGMGVSLATLSGQVLADLALGRREPWSELLYLDDEMLPLPPEPFRFLGFQGGYYAMRIADFIDRYR